MFVWLLCPRCSLCKILSFECLRALWDFSVFYEGFIGVCSIGIIFVFLFSGITQIAFSYRCSPIQNIDVFYFPYFLFISLLLGFFACTIYHNLIRLHRVPKGFYSGCFRPIQQTDIKAYLDVARDRLS